MDKWRRIAIEELPSYKQTIEEAEDSSHMWGGLWAEFHELVSANDAKPRKTGEMQKIYNFAVRCSKLNESDPLAVGVWQFFYHIVGQFVIENMIIRDYLPKHMSSSDFANWLTSVEDEFPERELNKAKGAFSAAKRKQRR